jgi:hypothetical protein
MELIFWSIVCALAIWGLLDILIGIFLPLELLLLLHDRHVARMSKKIKYRRLK